MAFNKFVANSDETLEAVSFFTAVDNVDYTVKIYDSFENGELLNELSTTSGNIEYVGFHTIDLQVPVELTNGNDFYIYLYLSNGGQPFDRTSEIPVLLGASYRTIVESSSNPEESYYYDNSSWHDFYNYEFEDTQWNHSANFCIKGLATGQSSSIISPENLMATLSNYNNVTLEWEMPRINRDYNFIAFEIYRNDEVIFELSEMDQYPFTDVNLFSGNYSYYVTTLYEEGESAPSNIVNVEINLLPPSNLTASIPPNSNNVLLMWEAPPSNRYLTGYKIYKNNNLIGEINNTFYIDNDVQAGSYNYYITAVYSEYESDPSNIVNIEMTSTDDHNLNPLIF